MSSTSDNMAAVEFILKRYWRRTQTTRRIECTPGVELRPHGESSVHRSALQSVVRLKSLQQ